MFNKGVIKFINFSFGEQRKIVIQGRIQWKYIEDRKGVDHYFIRVTDAITNVTYKFKVDEGAYMNNELDGFINKEFTIGSLGIVYRKNE